MKAVVVALGKMGLPLAAQIASAGHQVIGCDIDERTVRLVAAGQAPFPGEPGLEERLAEAVAGGHLTTTTDTAEAVAADPDLVLCVPPLYVDAHVQPDWKSVDAVCSAVGAGLRRGTTVAFETTLPVGTTRNRIAPALEEHSGLTAGSDFHVIFSPERVSTGRVFRDLATYPKLVGGLDEEGERRGVELYASFLEAEIWPMGSAEASELTKLAETTYRDVNIALANEYAKFADRLGVDMDRVIDAANSQPFSHIHRPGVAVGGHCIPVYPRFYLAGDPGARLPAVARDVNETMPPYAVELLAQEIGGLEGKRILVLGVAYRGGVKESAFSGAAAVHDELVRRGAISQFADPLYDDGELRAQGYEPWDGDPVDGAIVQADHEQYRDLRPEHVGEAMAVVDGRGFVDPTHLRAAGIPVLLIGQPALRPERDEAAP